jgi:Fe-S oxidoreductase
MVSDNLRGRVTEKASRLLNKIADELLNSNPNAIFRNGDSIMAFADYEIVRESADEYSIYRNDYLVQTCSTCRIALTYCILDKNKMQMDAKHLVALEEKLLGRQNEMMHYRHVITSPNTDDFRREVVLHRLDSAKHEYHIIQKQLTKSINVAKYCQQKGFENETI